MYKPTTIDASEIGTKYRSADNRLNLGLALYRNKMKDDHMSVTASPPEYKSETLNVDSRSQGIELSADWRMTNNWQIKTQLAYTDAKVTDATEVPPPARPGMLRLTAKNNPHATVPKIQWQCCLCNTTMSHCQCVVVCVCVCVCGSTWGKNPTDERYEHIKNIYPMNVGILGTDRSYGLKYSYYY